MNLKYLRRILSIICVEVLLGVLRECGLPYNVEHKSSDILFICTSLYNVLAAWSK